RARGNRRHHAAVRARAARRRAPDAGLRRRRPERRAVHALRRDLRGRHVRRDRVLSGARGMSAQSQRAQRMRSSLWALILPPTIWAAHFWFCYVFAALYCAKAGTFAPLGVVRAAIALATAAALGVVLAAGFVAWAKSRIPGDPPPHDESTDEDRVR